MQKAVDASHCSVENSAWRVLIVFSPNRGSSKQRLEVNITREVDKGKK
jgi:hypothetical protein